MSLDEAFAKVISEKEASLFRPSASQVAAAAKEYGYIELVVFPGLDATIAASIAAKVLLSNSVEFAVKFAALAPRELNEPTLLIGYPAAVAAEVTAKKPSALIGYGERPKGILPLAVTSSTDSSLTALAVGVFSEIAIVGRTSVYAAVAGYWRGLDKGKRGEFIGVENSIIEMLRLENVIEQFFNLRLFRWPQLPTEKALAITLLPYLPGLTGRHEEAEKFLREDPRLEPLLGKTLEEAAEQAVAVLGEKLYDILKKTSRVPRRPTEIIGYIYYSRSSPLPDLREAAAILACYASEAGLTPLVGLGLDEAGVAGDAHYVYRRRFDSLVAYVEPLVAARLASSGLGRLQLAQLPGEPPCLPLAERILSQSGVVPPGSVAAANNKVLLESIVDAVGYGVFRELVERSCIEPIPGTLYGEVRSDAC